MSSSSDVDDEKFCRFCSNLAERLLKASKPTRAENVNQGHSRHPASAVFGFASL